MPPPIPDEAVPGLAAHARRRTDPLTHQPLLLYPEGALELDEIGAAILDLCDGTRNVGKISLALAETYDAPADEIRRDVEEYLASLLAQGLIRIGKGGP